MNVTRSEEVVLNDIKSLVRSQGYIYALCMILSEDFHVDAENIHELNVQERLSINEASLLLGFLIQDEIDFSIPNSHEKLFEYKKKTYELLEELHFTFISFEPLSDNNTDHSDVNILYSSIGGIEGRMIEPIFYAGENIYDFQYLQFLDKKYKYDKEWLHKNKKFHIDDVVKITYRIKSLLQEKSSIINFYGIKEKKYDYIDNLKISNKLKEKVEQKLNENLPLIELSQYTSLFGSDNNSKKLKIESISQEEWSKFYDNLLELFIFKKEDFEEIGDIESFFNNFSVKASTDCNNQFQKIGNFNLINAKPIIQLDSQRFFIPISYLVFAAVYESPFYWMSQEDKTYKNQLSTNRGLVGEEMACHFLSQVFGANRTFRSVKIRSKKGHDDTDIDTLCILGSKALCVQVKSKKLTELSKLGSNDHLQKDFRLAIQDAYDQGIICRNKILEKGARFFDENNNEIFLSEEIDDVYILGITTENYPALLHQIRVFLQKKETDPHPIFVSIFDLELLVHYLDDPYDFLYYIRQRISLMNCFLASAEMDYLGFHLQQKLYREPKATMIYIDHAYALVIDRNYYPLKAGIKVSDKGDKLKSLWKNENFTLLCDQIKTINEPKSTDIIFHLLDFSLEVKDNIMMVISNNKRRTLLDNKNHNQSMIPIDINGKKVGITYVSLASNNPFDLRKNLLGFVELRKYDCRADIWIGLGSFINSDQLFDMIVYDYEEWKYDEKLENLCESRLKKDTGQLITNRKIGRNEKCPCGSDVKYKNCHGK